MSGEHLNRVLSIAFAVSGIAWMCSYIALLEPGFLIGEILWILALVSLPIGGWFASCWKESTWKSASAVGLVSSLINLMILGSLLGKDIAQQDFLFITLSILAVIFMTVILSTLGIFIKLNNFVYKFEPPSWLSFFGFTVAGITFFMIVSGGIVTGLEVGLAVPDWPNSYGHNMLLYPLTEMKNDLNMGDESLGIFYEHAHRLIGMLVGLAVLVFSWRVLVSRKGFIRLLAFAASFIVCFQGILGGLRVTEVNTFIGVLHGVLGQIFFSLLVLISVFLSSLWCKSIIKTNKITSTDVFLASGLILISVIQLILGTSYRQISSDSTFSESFYNLFLLAHVLNSFVVLLLSIYIAIRMASFKEVKQISIVGKVLLSLVLFQFLGGILALTVVLVRKTEHIPKWEVLFTSVHQSSGALFLATSLITFFVVCKFFNGSNFVFSGISK